MTNSFLTLVTIAAFTVLLLAVVIVARVNPPIPTTQGTPLSHEPSSPPAGILISGPQMANQQPREQAPQAESPAFTQPLTNAVSTTDLSNLAAAVHLKNAGLTDVDKNQWKTALAKAQQLLQGACDCEERNWLNHFVETGNEALSGAKEYEQSARFLLSLPKNDEEAMKHVVSE